MAVYQGFLGASSHHLSLIIHTLIGIRLNGLPGYLYPF